MKKFFKIMLATTLIVSAVLFLGCSKDEDNGGGKGVVKFTVTTSSEFNTSGGHSILAGMSSSDLQAKFLPIKINGEQTDGSVVAHTKADADFNGGKTYVFESVGNYNTAVLNINGYCVGDVPFVLTYKVEQGSEVIAENSITLTKGGNPYNRNYVLD